MATISERYVGRTRHDWTEEDDIGLLLAVEQCADLAEHYRRQGRPECQWWDAVAGVLHRLRDGQIRVTGAACRARWGRIEDTPAGPGQPEMDGWQRASAILARWVPEARGELLRRIEEAADLAVELGDGHVAAVLDAAALVARRAEAAERREGDPQ